MIQYFSCLLVGSVLGYLLHKKILLILIEPLNQPVFYASPAGGFDFILKISIFFGFLISLPILIYHVVRFASPALPYNQSSVVYLSLLFSGVFLIFGVLFAYYISLPATLHFLSTFSTNEIRSLISTTEYFSFVTRHLVGFGIIFQLPLIMLILNKFYKISPKSLLKYEKHVILGSFIAAAILTPTPDMFNQLIMAIPIIFLYQITVIFIWTKNKN